MKKLKKIICVNMFINVIIALITLFVFGCKENGSRIEENKDYELIKNAEYLEDLFEETSILIDNPPKVQIYNNSFYANGNIYLGNNLELYKFNKNGKLASKLSKVGHGPEEYPYFNVWYVDNRERVIIPIPAKKKIFIYDKNLNFIRSFDTANEMGHIKNIKTFEDKIICYNPGARDYPIVVYTYKGKVVNKFGVPDKLIYKYNSLITSGSIDIAGKAIFQINAHEYKIYKFGLEGNLLTTIIPEKTNFKTISKYRGNIIKTKGDYSIVYDFFVIKNLLFVRTINYDPETRGKALYDILDEQGNIIREKIELNWRTTKFDHLVKYSDEDFIAFNIHDYLEDIETDLKFTILHTKL